MKSIDIYEALGEISESNLDVADSYSPKRYSPAKWIAAAAAAFVLVAGVLAATQIFKKPYNGRHTAFLPTVTPTEQASEQPTEFLVTPEHATDTPIVPTEYLAPDSTQKLTNNPIQSPTDALTAVPTSAPTAVSTSEPIEMPTPKPTPTLTGVPTAPPTPLPTEAPTSNPSPTPTVAVPTDVPIFYEFSSEEELVAAIKAGEGCFFDSIRYYYAPKHEPFGTKLDNIIISNAGIEFDYSGNSKSFGFMWLWNTDSDEYIAHILPYVNEEQHGRYYAYHQDGKLWIVWGQDNATFLATVPEGTSWEEIEYLCDAKLNIVS